jgi:hypothetical protein
MAARRGIRTDLRSEARYTAPDDHQIKTKLS